MNRMIRRLEILFAAVAFAEAGEFVTALQIRDSVRR